MTCIPWCCKYCTLNIGCVFANFCWFITKLRIEKCMKISIFISIMINCAESMCLNKTNMLDQHNNILLLRCHHHLLLPLLPFFSSSVSSFSFSSSSFLPLLLLLLFLLLCLLLPLPPPLLPLLPPFHNISHLLYLVWTFNPCQAGVRCSWATTSTKIF